MNRVGKGPQPGYGGAIVRTHEIMAEPIRRRQVHLQKKTGYLRTNVEPERIIFKYKTAQPEINVINGGRTRRLRKGDVT